MTTLFATRLKSKRLEQQLSQVELAQGICEQGQISRMEKGKYIPSSDLLYKLSKKLNVSMDYFFDESVSESRSALTHFKAMTKKFLRLKEYDSLKYLYDLEVSRQNRLTLADQIYLEWIDSIVCFYYENRKEEGIQKLQDTISKLESKDMTYLSLSNTLLTYYFETDNLLSFEEVYATISSYLHDIEIGNVEDLEFFIRFNYNVCRYLWLTKNNECIDRLLITIEKCKEYKFWYLLPDLYCLLGNASENFASDETIQKYFQTALFFYQLDNNEKMSLEIEKYLTKYYK